MLTAKDLTASPYLRLLVYGGAKMGKTWCVLRTCEKPVLVINSDDRHSLRSAAAGIADKDFGWLLMLGDNLQTTENVLGEVKREVAAGKFKTVVWDTLTSYAKRSLTVYEKQTENAKGESDGRRFYRNQHKHLHGIINRLFALDAHVIVNSHYTPEGGAVIDGQLEKVGDGIVAGIEGKGRFTIPAEFQDVVYLDKKGDQRIFVCSSSGVWGPGCRTLPGVTVIDADISKLWGLMLKSPGKIKTLPDMKNPTTTKPTTSQAIKGKTK